MASESDHVALANRNHKALLHLVQDHTEFPEWIATIAFYKAVHVVEAVIANELHQHSTSHHQRLLSLKTSRFAALFKQYRPLLTASRVARYLEDHGDSGLDGTSSVNPPAGRFATFVDYLSADDVVTELLDKRLYSLEQNALPFLSPAARTALEKYQP